MINDPPLINILTRTSGRPLFFERCVESVAKQDYRNIRHIVSCDDPEDLKYISNYNVDVLEISKEDVLESPYYDIPKPSTSRIRCNHNLYMNKMMDYVDDGWIMCLDDDDYFGDKEGNIEEGAVTEIVSAIDSLSLQCPQCNKEITVLNEDKIIYFQMWHQPLGRFIPKEPFFGPEYGNIGSPCFLFHSKWKNHSHFDCWSGADYRFISLLHKQVGNFSLLRDKESGRMRSLTHIGSCGNGSRLDIKS